MKQKYVWYHGMYTTSSYVDKEPMGKKADTSVARHSVGWSHVLEAFFEYNKYVGSINLPDNARLLSYECEIQKIVHKNIFPLILNSWVLSRWQNPDQQIPLFDFKIVVVVTPAKAGKVVKIGRPSS